MLSVLPVLIVWTWPVFCVKSMVIGVVELWKLRMFIAVAPLPVTSDSALPGVKL